MSLGVQRALYESSRKEGKIKRKGREALLSVLCEISLRLCVETNKAHAKKKRTNAKIAKIHLGVKLKMSQRTVELK